MKLPISNRYGYVIQMLFFSVGVTIAAVSMFELTDHFSADLQGSVSGFSMLVGIFLCFYSTIFYTVSFDDKHIYFSRHGAVNILPLGAVVKIKPGVFPVRVQLGNIYVVSIVYMDNGRKKRIRFFSKRGTGITGTNDKIPFLDMLRERIREAK